MSAALGTNTTVLRKALEEKGIRWFDQTNMEPGSDWLDTIEKAMKSADFICLLLQDEQNANTLVELGIALAKRKPILALLGPSTLLPSDLSGFTYVRTHPTDESKVTSALEMFLEHAPLERQSKGRLPRQSKRTAGEKSSLARTAGFEAERRTAELLQEAGYIVSGESETRDQGADFAVWIDELQHPLGNPLLVEVKTGKLSASRVQQAAAQLRHYVTKTHGRCALLVYWDRHNREFPPVSTELPLVFQLSGRALTQLVTEGRLAKELLRLRNAVVHGEV